MRESSTPPNQSAAADGLCVLRSSVMGVRERAVRSTRAAEAVAELGSLNQSKLMNASAQADEYLHDYRCGERDEAFFGLLEMDPGILPVLMAAFRSERDSRVRAFLVEVIWQHRQTSVIPFLGEALQDPESEVWRQALDGLVSLASAAALAVLHTARSRRDDSAELHRWIDEAIDQVESEIQKVLAVHRPPNRSTE